MGYQETWLYIRPQYHFDSLKSAYARAKLSGYYDDFTRTLAEPLSIATLKQPFGHLSAGTKILWVCGERAGHSAGHIFGEEAKTLPLFKRLEIISVETVLEQDDKRLNGIDFSSDAPTENAYIRRESAAAFARQLTEKPECDMMMKL